MREVNRVIDEGILPNDFLDTQDGRRIAPAACFLIAFYVDSAERLTPRERRFVVDEASARLRKGSTRLSASPANEDWIVTDEFLAVNLNSFVQSVEERWKRLTRLAGVKCVRPSAVSTAGETVAAFAAHMLELLHAAARRTGSARCALAMASASLPVKPRRRSVGRCGRSCGGRTACFNPRSARNFIFASPCSAAWRGLDATPRWLIEAGLP